MVECRVSAMVLSIELRGSVELCNSTFFQNAANSRLM